MYDDLLNTAELVWQKVAAKNPTSITDLKRKKGLIYKAPNSITDVEINGDTASWFLMADGSFIGSTNAPHHSEIAAIALGGWHPDDLENDEEWKTLWQFMEQFHAIRVITGDEKSANFDLHTVKPTSQQMQAMGRLAKGKQVFWDTKGGGGQGSFGDFQRAIK